MKNANINLPAGRQECKITMQNFKIINFINFTLSFSILIFNFYI